MVGVPSILSGPNGPIRVRNDGAPCEGAKVYSWSINFGNAPGTPTNFDLDLINPVEQGIIHGVEGLYIENYIGTTPSKPLTVFCYSTGQTIIVPGNSRGFYPVFLANPPRWNVTANSLDGSVKIWAANFAVSPFVSNLNTNIITGGGSGVQLFDLDGSLQVNNFKNFYDANKSLQVKLYGTIIDPNGNLDVDARFLGNADIIYADRRGTSIYNGSVATTVPLVVVAGNPGYFITELDIALSANVSQAAAGLLPIIVKDGVTVLATLNPFVPAASVASAGEMRVLRLDNLNFFSTVANNQLTVTLGAALTGGTCTVTACGGTTATLGV